MENINLGTKSLEILNTGSKNNIAIGNYSLNTCAGNSNLAIGNNVLTNISGSNNISIGDHNMEFASCDNNISIGISSMICNNGSNNVSIGSNNLEVNNIGSFNTILGNSSLKLAVSSNNNIILGNNNLNNIIQGSNNIVLGNNSDFVDNLDHVLLMGNSIYAKKSNSTYLDPKFIQQYTENLGTYQKNLLFYNPSSGEISWGPIDNTILCDCHDNKYNIHNSNNLIHKSSCKQNKYYYKSYGMVVKKSKSDLTTQNITIINKDDTNDIICDEIKILSNIKEGYNSAIISGSGDFSFKNSAYGSYSLENMNDTNLSNNNTALGYSTLSCLTQANNNTAVGSQTLMKNLASRNTAVGSHAMMYNSSGVNNVSIGDNTLKKCNGDFNTVIGSSSAINVNASYNTIVGGISGNNLLTGYCNILIGDNNSKTLAYGNNNIIIGSSADVSDNSVSNCLLLGSIIGESNSFFIDPIYFNLNSNNTNSNNTNSNNIISINKLLSYNCQTGKVNLQDNILNNFNDNLFLGNQSLINILSNQKPLSDNATGNISFGLYSLQNILNKTNNNYNISIGTMSLQTLKDGNCNSSIGYKALNSLLDGNNNLAYGCCSLSNLKEGYNNLAIGNYSGLSYRSDEHDNILIGSEGNINDKNVIRIGQDKDECYISGIYNSENKGRSVIIDQNGRLSVNEEEILLANIINGINKDFVIFENNKPIRVNFMKLLPWIINKLQTII